MKRRPKLGPGEKRLRIRWYDGAEPPAFGHLIASARGRAAFRVLSVTAGPQKVDAHGPHTPLVVIVERVARSLLPEAEVVHLIRWDRPGAKERPPRPRRLR